LCLRLQAKGLRILFTPHAVLDHLESVSRGEDLRPEHVARARREVEVMRQRWGARLLHDPYYSPNLSLQTEQEALAFPPRVQPV
jgi:GT2 family glycosyltransferase